MKNEFTTHAADLPEKAARLPLHYRVMDLTFAVAALPLLAGVTFVVAVVSAFAAPGPVYYRHEAVDWSGRPIRVYRFRTLRMKRRMSAGADAPFLPGGRFLRSSGLAELPQILNLLRGELTLFSSRVSRATTGPIHVEAEPVLEAPPAASTLVAASAPALSFNRSRSDR